MGRGRQGILTIFLFSFLLTQENTTEETDIHLDKKLFELFLTLSQCLGSAEEMLQTPGLSRGDVCAQQAYYEVGNFQQARVLAISAVRPLFKPELKPLKLRAHSLSSCLSTLQTLALELKKLYLAMSDKKNDLLKAMTRPGRTTSLFPECFDNLQVYLERTQAAAASRSKSLKAGLDYNRSYQVQVWVRRLCWQCFRFLHGPLISVNFYSWWHL